MSNEAHRLTVMALGLYRLNLGMEIKVRAAGGNPLAWDDHLQGFRAMVESITYLRQLRGDFKTDDKVPFFHLSMGDVGLLSCVVLRCRDPTLRRTALSLLESRTVQDGLLNSAVSIPLLRRVIELEEQDVAVPSCASILANARVIAVRRSKHPDSCEVTFQFIDREHRESVKASTE